MYVVELTETAEGCLDLLEPDDRQRILRCLVNITINPAYDGIFKFPMHHIGKMYTLYDDRQGAWVLYYLDGMTIMVSGLGIGGPYVPYETND